MILHLQVRAHLPLGFLLIYSRVQSPLNDCALTSSTPLLHRVTWT